MIKISLRGGREWFRKKYPDQRNARPVKADWGKSHAFLDRVQGSIALKDDVMKCFRQASGKEEIASGLMGLELPESWRAVLMEMTIR